MRVAQSLDSSLPVLLATMTLAVLVQIAAVLCAPDLKTVKGEETMVSIMMKPADARGKYTALAGLAPADRKPLCTIRAKDILAADKALVGILEKAADHPEAPEAEPSADAAPEAEAAP